MITLSIDVTLLEKARFKEITRRNGKRAVFCDLVLIESPGSEYGDYMVKQSKRKGETVELPILGNAKILGGNRQAAPATAKPAAASNNDDGLPI